MHEKAKLHYLSYRRQQHLLLYVFDKKIKGIDVDEWQISTRAHNGVRLKNIKVGNRKFYRSIDYRAHGLWNMLDVHLTHTDSNPQFKALVKRSFSNPYE